MSNNISSFHTNNTAIQDQLVSTIYDTAKEISDAVVVKQNSHKKTIDDKIDDILTSKWTGFPVMFIVLASVLWLTIAGANVPSSLLASGLFWIEDTLTDFFMWINAPAWLHGVLVLGLYRGLAWVVSVMLPPMAIFFPCFTLLEDLGYLPRVAFNLDRLFKKAGAHGKQALTMSMGFGCNAAGVIACRIIDSPRERLLATVTNNFVPCNGRFPTLITISMIIMGAIAKTSFGSFLASGMVALLVIIGIIITLIVSYILSKTLLRGKTSSFKLELPPYRRPQFGRVIVTSIFDRTLFVLGRAVVIAAPAGAITWILANVMIGDLSILQHVSSFLDPFGLALGMDGIIILAFILGLPANEIVLPIIFMSYLSTGSMIELESIVEIRNLFIDNGWTVLTCMNVMLFSLLHFPCGTTLWTIRKETQSIKWTLASFIIPTVIAITICFTTTQIAKLFN